MIARIRSYFNRNVSWYLALSFFLFSVSIFIFTSVIGRLDRSIQLDNLRLIVLLATLFVISIAAFRKPRAALLSLLSFVSGVIVSFTVIGDLMQPFILYLRFALSYQFSRIQHLFSTDGALPNPAQPEGQWLVLSQNVSVLRERLMDWLRTLPESAYDPVSLNLVWGIVIWLTTIWVYWFVIKRKRVVIGFMPLLLIIAGANSSIDSGLVWLALLLGIGFLLAVLGKQAKLEAYWKKSKLAFSEIILRRAVQYALYLSAGLVMFGILLTSPELENFFEELREQRRQAQSSEQSGASDSDLTLLQEETPEIGPEAVLADTTDGWLPNVHLIGNDPELAETEVFLAEVQGLYAVPGQRHYFRSANYESYTLRGWQNKNKDYTLIPPEQEFEIDFTSNEQLIYQEVTLLRDFPEGNLMYVVGELTAANVPYYGSFHTKFVNNTYIDLFASVTGETQYVAYSVAPFFEEGDLRSASQNFPSWIENKYLQVPEFTTDRVYDLAISLTATEPTPYDRALAIEAYLRGIEYSLDLPPPPKNSDIVDYFIYDLQRGYCDYYASAMVILSRAAGIPARLVTGYLVSTYDPVAKQYVVTADQAHSWAEVFFPDYGWVIFEPTAGQPALDRSQDHEIIPEELALEPEFEELLQDQQPEKITLIPGNLFILAGEMAALVAVGLVAYQWIDHRILSTMDPRQMLTRVYNRLQRRAARVGVRNSPTNTPLEYSQIVQRALSTQSEKKYYRTILNSTPEKAARIVSVCNRAAYSNQLPEVALLEEVIALWERLSWQLFLAGLLYRLEPIRATFRRIWFRLQQPA